MAGQRPGANKNASGGSHALPLVVPTQQTRRKMAGQVRAHITDGPPGRGRSHYLVTPDTPQRGDQHWPEENREATSCRSHGAHRGPPMSAVTCPRCEDGEAAPRAASPARATQLFRPAVPGEDAESFRTTGQGTRGLYLPRSAFIPTQAPAWHPQPPALPIPPSGQSGRRGPQVPARQPLRGPAGQEARGKKGGGSWCRRPPGDQSRMLTLQRAAGGSQGSLIHRVEKP